MIIGWSVVASMSSRAIVTVEEVEDVNIFVCIEHLERLEALNSKLNFALTPSLTQEQNSLNTLTHSSLSRSPDSLSAHSLARLALVSLAFAHSPQSPSRTCLARLSRSCTHSRTRLTRSPRSLGRSISRPVVQYASCSLIECISVVRYVVYVLYQMQRQAEQLVHLANYAPNRRSKVKGDVYGQNMSAEVVEINPYSRLMALQRMGIVENYERIREFSVAIVVCKDLNIEILFLTFRNGMLTFYSFGCFFFLLQGNLKVRITQLLQEALIGTHRWLHVIVFLFRKSLMGESVMQSPQLFVFGPKNYELFLEDFRVDNYTVGGFGGLIRRKKGVVAVRIGFKGVNILFICCHFSGTRIDVCCSEKSGLLLSTMATIESLGLDIQRCVIGCFSDFAMQASCSEELGTRSSASSEEIKETLFCYLIVLLLHLQEHCRLYMAYTCPFAQRAWITRNYKGLQDKIQLEIAFNVTMKHLGKATKHSKLISDVEKDQYQSSLSAAVKELNRKNWYASFEVVRYLVEELRDKSTYKTFCKDFEDANAFSGSLIFVEELAQKIKSALEKERDRLDAVLVLPSMPEVTRLNKLGSFSMSQLGQSKSPFFQLFKRKKQSSAGFADSMLKLVRTLPKVLKYFPSDKAQDARLYILSLQFWLGGSSENLHNFLKTISRFWNGKNISGAGDPALKGGVGAGARV
ncbi:hypothetical protein Syun_014093 [Stephania yunnanensis]|uniref:magnesium chelatase n=1 Tax=Stephania yunnanensis TaxID=152371 RepID=A0AAP0JKC8_9MAGN